MDPTDLLIWADWAEEYLGQAADAIRALAHRPRPFLSGSGCNAGEVCACPRGPVLRPATSMVLPAWQPATTWAPALAPMMPAFAYPAGGGLRSGGC